jgi:hypothetical protein
MKGPGLLVAALACAVFLVACGSGPGPGGCPTVLCGGACCSSGQQCINGACGTCSTPCGAACCTGQEQCINGACCVPCGGSCCTSTQTCLNGSCCSNPCGSTCCNQGAVCVQDMAGNKACATACTTNADCPGAKACCAELQGGGSACVSTQFTNPCLCATKSDCANIPGKGACVPIVSGDVVSEKAYACQPNDGGAWHGCTGVSCGSGYDCWKDARGNEMCSRSCAADATCGNPGIACCNKQATCTNAVFSCGGPGGCMTCP